MRSTTASRAWTICSIQTMVTPVARSFLISSIRSCDLGLGQAAGDLVRGAGAGIGSQGPGQFQAFAIEQGERARQHVHLLVQAGDLQDLHAMRIGGPSPLMPRPCVAPTSTFSNTVMPEKGFGIWKVRPMP